MSAPPVLPSYNEARVSTKTFTAVTNLSIDLDILYRIINVVPYNIVKKKRGRRTKEDVELEDAGEPNKDIPHGSVIFIKYKNTVNGVSANAKKYKTRCFRNSMSIDIILDKVINYKISSNGTLQLTGCKSSEHVLWCIKYLWLWLKQDPESYTFRYGTQPEGLIIPCMRNIDMQLGFLVDREKLNEYMSKVNELYCLMETSFVYTGVNISVPLENDIEHIDVKRVYIDEESGEWETTWVYYGDCLDMFDTKTRSQKYKKARYNTFLVFQSGKVIMSGLTSRHMRPSYEYFMNLMRDAYEYIEERLEQPKRITL